MIRALVTIVFLACANLVQGQPSIRQIKQLCDSLANQGIADHLIPGLTLAIVKQDSSITANYGLRDVEKQLPVDSTTLFQLGSVGKLMTVIAVLQQVEASRLNLHADVNMYLNDFSVSSPGRPITLFDLLTHTAGLNDRNIGYLARNNGEVESLGEHLRQSMPSSFEAPGLEINYSNYGYALAGHIVEQVAGTPFTVYVNDHILRPLAMTHTSYALPDNYLDLDNYAHGYRTRDTFEPVVSYPRHATPAGSLLSNAGDMAKLAKELLHPSGKILSDSSVLALRKRQFSNHPKLMGYTLGFEEQNRFGVRGIAKGGAFPGFLSELVIFPEQDFALFSSTNTQTDNFFEAFHQELLKHILPGNQPGDSSDLSRKAIQRFVGVYRSERYNHESVEDLLALYQGKLELWASTDGDLSTYQNGAVQHYRPVDSLLFQNARAPEQYLAFALDPEGNISRLYTNLNLAGFYVPVSLSRVSWYDDPVFINEYYFVILLFIFTILFVPLFRLWVILRRRNRPGYWSARLVPNVYLYIGIAVATLYLIHLFGGFLYLAKHINEFYFGVPQPFKNVQQVTWAFAPMVFLFGFLALRIWARKSGTIVFRIYYSIVFLCAVVHLLFLYRWHFIGLHV